MPMTPALRDYLAYLNVAERVPLPPLEEWGEHVARLSVPGRIAEVSEEHYFYWLEVLPPKFMSGSLFGFAEGAEELRLFWQDKDNRYWMRQLTWDERTGLHPRLAADGSQPALWPEDHRKLLDVPRFSTPCPRRGRRTLSIHQRKEQRCALIRSTEPAAPAAARWTSSTPMPSP